MKPTPQSLTLMESRAFYHQLQKEIQNAHSEILMEVYLFDFDSLGLEILEQLKKARQRQVQVFLTIDGVGSWSSALLIERFCQTWDIKLHIYHPLWPISSWPLWLRSLNKRNHRKMFVFDQTRFYFGSLNLSNSHLFWWDLGAHFILDASAYTWVAHHFERARSRWSLSFHFQTQWKSRQLFSYARKKKQDPFILFNQTLRDRFLISYHLAHQIKKAQRLIVIITPYFLPRRFLLQALKRAAQRGVQVRLYLPRRSDIGALQGATRHLYRQLLKRNVQIYELTDQILHAKALVIDDQVYLGSMNWNHRSFLHDLEILVRSSQSELAANLEQKIAEMRPQFNRIDPSQISQTPLWQRLGERLFYWFRYWL